MRALTYRVTHCLDNIWPWLAQKQPRGYGYESAHVFVHISGVESALWSISTGLSIIDSKQGVATLRDWIARFGAQDIEDVTLDVGETVEGVWRPGLYYDDQMLQALSATNVDLRLAEQSLLLLIQRLDEILLYVEPTTHALSTHSHKARELLILACTEVEAQWKHHLIKAGRTPPPRGFSTNDYVDLRDPLFLTEYEVSLPRYTDVPAIRPFLGWTSTAPGPTKSLPWYDAYNKTKHDGRGQFNAATLLACIEAVAANIVMFVVRFGPFRLYQSGGVLAALFNPMFSISLKDCDPTTFYVPQLDTAQRTTRTWGKFEEQPWTPRPFRC